VGGMISASSRKNTVSDSRMEMDKLTCEHQTCVKVCKVMYCDVTIQDTVANQCDSDVLKYFLP
jgi:hypothetical protein